MLNKLTDDALDRSLLYILGQHIGKEKAVDRWDLVETVFGEYVPEQFRNDSHPLDREIRYAVNRLRKAGHLICDLGNGKGRYIAKNEAEFWELYNYYVKPIKERAEVARAMKKAAVVRWPNALQFSMFGGAPDDLDVN